MESTDTPTQRTPISGLKPRRSATKTYDPVPEHKRAASTLPGLSLPELANVSTSMDAATDELALAHLERCIAETTFESFEGVVVTDARPPHTEGQQLIYPYHGLQQTRSHRMPVQQFSIDIQ